MKTNQKIELTSEQILTLLWGIDVDNIISRYVDGELSGEDMKSYIIELSDVIKYIRSKDERSFKTFDERIDKLLEEADDTIISE